MSRTERSTVESQGSNYGSVQVQDSTPVQNEFRFSVSDRGSRLRILGAEPGTVCLRKRWYQKPKYYTLLAMSVITIVGMIIAGIVVAAISGKRKEPGTPLTRILEPFKHDCYPDMYKTLRLDPINDHAEECRKRQCVWDGEAKDGNPKCSFPRGWTNYEPIGLTSSVEGEMIRIDMKHSNRHSGYKKDAKYVRIEITGYNDTTVRIRVTDRDVMRWEPPILIEVRSGNIFDPLYEIVPTNTSVKIKRKRTRKVLFAADFDKMIFSDQFIQLTVNVSSKTLCGFGQKDAHCKSVKEIENNHRKNYLFFNYGAYTSETQKSTYSGHPVYLMYEEKGTSLVHGVMLINSNPMEIVFNPEPSLTYRTLGGILDFFVFMGPTGTEVRRQKALLTGLPVMPPYWALGFHLSRYGYDNEQKIREVLKRNIDAGVPVEAQWLDIEYQNDFNLWTIDNNTFPTLRQFVDELHESGRHFVPNMNPAVSVDPSVPGFYEGEQLGIFVKDETGKRILRTSIRQPVSAIIDFTHNQTENWFTRGLETFHAQLPFDGIWLGMNVPLTTNYYGKFGWCVNDTYDKPEYNPVYPKQLEEQTICMSAQHQASNHYNIHNVYGWYSGKVVFEALKQTISPRRPFVLSMSTTTGSGSHVGTWSGDIDSSWDHMRESIPDILDFALFGIPMTGSDICGFNLNTRPELCARWSSLGAFYPFSRNHNLRKMIDQDPAAMGGDVLDSAKKSLKLRYKLLPFLYTLFYKSSKSGDSVVRSLKFNFPEDENVNGNDRQFMWSDCLLISPVLEENKTSHTAYFPSGRWYDINDGILFSEGGKNKTFSVPMTDISVTQRGGSIIPSIESDAVTTRDHRKGNFSILVALDDEEKASGDLYWDDGDSMDTCGYFCFIEFTVKNQKFETRPETFACPLDNHIVSVRISGLKRPIESVFLSNTQSETQLSAPEDYQIFGTELMAVNSSRLSTVSFAEGFSIRWTTQ